jgi:hypothetical protein
MDKKGLLSWIPMALLILVGGAVIWSIWSSLVDTRAKLEAQQKKMAEILGKDVDMNRYVDSLEVVLSFLQQRDSVLTREREQFMVQLAVLEYKHQQALARIDTLWEFSEVNEELDRVFPQWKGQFMEARRPDGVHSIIVPRFFGAYVSEIKTELDNSDQKMAVKDSLIGNYKESLVNKDTQVNTVVAQRDSIETTYTDLLSEYQVLDQKYRKEVKSHWFKFSLGNAVYAGVGFGAGYLIGRQ